MKMKPAKVTIDLDDYESSDNQIVPDSGDFRLERRWKRWELSNTREKHNHHDGSTRSTINNCGNVSILSLQEGHMSEDELDGDYKLFLLRYNYEDIDVVSDDNADDSDNDINIGYNSVHYDSQCMMFLEEERFHNLPKLNTGMRKGSKQRYETRKNGNKGNNSVRKQLSDPIKSQLNLEAQRRLSKKRLREDVSVVTGNHCYTEMKGSKQSYETGNPAYKGSDSVQKQTSRSLKSCQNLEAKRGHSKKRPHEDVCGVHQNGCHSEMMKGRKQSCESGNKGSDSVRKQTRVTRKSQQNLEARRGLSKKRPYENVSVVPENNCYSNTELDVVDEDYQTFLNSRIHNYVPSELLRKSSSVMGNSQVSDRVLSEADEDYLQYLNFLSIDDEVECMPERNTSRTDMPESKSTKTDMPEKNTSMTDMAKRNTTKTDMPKRNTTKTDMPEKNILKPDMSERNTTKTDMPKRNTTKTDMPRKNTLKTDMRQRNTLETDMPKWNTTETSETDMPKRNTTKTVMPKRNTTKIDMVKRNTLKTDMPKWNTTETSETDMPKRNTPETGMPKWNTTKIDMRLRKTLKSGMLDRNTFKTDMPERNALHTHMPKRNISNTVNVHGNTNLGMPKRNISNAEPDVILLEPDQIQENTPFVSSKTYDSSWFGTEVNLKHMPGRNMSNTVNVDGGSNSSEPDVIPLEPDQLQENIPFVSSKTYDSSWFGTEVNLKHMPERNISNTVNVDGDSNSSEPDVILLEPDQIQENTPFVSSKTYDSSWFGTGVNLKDKWQLSAYHRSQFRKRLMNDLQRPYDKEEYNRLLLEVHQKRKTERHIETRQGVVKSYCTQGVNKSYLELYPDVAKAMDKFKKPERDLFILRGFIFWLQNLTHQGIFKPWEDIKCLEILSKM
ncbi:uncharacterized protein HKW66_Vig0226760 [Vigna angularis]|uniref:Uncharacterized protein n=1 Tax=Phaseolus angularis TaxID=3914 RepID=A0A8T0JZN3_PHAAN|nr:uncharacterized protein LOC108338689 [Vigna angularis]XP_017431218.1 uncharacterized protein LOC108338689 [Vigna angularis]XP_052736799.1 uncharacterized protein LOC108338689 [Vigna angularis]XP_052736800.1 uncharacterized protein LOC108338689 [Vigna angularis]KAG2389919.1 uncharacterized protein HKW66_Vig0226760 [Vigna angularis]